jgi:hypothetical protein
LGVRHPAAQFFDFANVQQNRAIFAKHWQNARKDMLLAALEPQALRAAGGEFHAEGAT